MLVICIKLLLILNNRIIINDLILDYQKEKFPQMTFLT
jgi:hypothetical protein